MSGNNIQITLSSQLKIQKSNLSEGMLTQIKNYLTLNNPKYLEAEKRGYFTGDLESKIYCFTEDRDYLYTYRGYLGSLLPFLCQNGYKYKLIDNRRRLPEVDFTFHGELRDYQQVAVMDALQKHFGIIVAPCGSGKTTMSIAMMAERRQPTLIVCHTKELLNQWAERITQYLGIPKKAIGIIGNGKETIKPVTVGMVQTLGKRDLEEISKHFGFLIVDECHHTPASTFLKVVSAFDSFYMLGLSATPYRRDKLNKMLYISLGNVVATIKDKDLQESGSRVKPEVIARETSFNYDYQEDSDYQPMISALIENQSRNQLIIDDVIQESDNQCLVLSDRKNHCGVLASLLKKQGINCAILTGSIPQKERESIIEQLNDGSLKVIFATGALAGEGLDIPKMSRLFITTPIRWKGRVKQYVGRILRTAEGKTDAKVFDYVDSKVGILANSYRSRCNQVYDRLN